MPVLVNQPINQSTAERTTSVHPTCTHTCMQMTVAVNKLFNNSNNDKTCTKNLTRALMCTRRVPQAAQYFPHGQTITCLRHPYRTQRTPPLACAMIIYSPFDVSFLPCSSINLARTAAGTHVASYGLKYTWAFVSTLFTCYPPFPLERQKVTFTSLRVTYRT